MKRREYRENGSRCVTGSLGFDRGGVRRSVISCQHSRFLASFLQIGADRNNPNFTTSTSACAVTYAPASEAFGVARPPVVRSLGAQSRAQPSASVDGRVTAPDFTRVRTARAVLIRDSGRLVFTRLRARRVPVCACVRRAAKKKADSRRAAVVRCVRRSSIVVAEPDERKGRYSRRVSCSPDVEPRARDGRNSASVVYVCMKPDLLAERFPSGRRVDIVAVRRRKEEERK